MQERLADGARVAASEEETNRLAAKARAERATKLMGHSREELSGMLCSLGVVYDNNKATYHL